MVSPNSSVKPTLRGIIFDFDGVILDSVHIKTQVFENIFRRFPSVAEQALAFHLSNRGRSRYENFRQLAVLLGKPDEGLVNNLASEFSRLVLERSFSCTLIPGAAEFLRIWCDLLPLYIASSTPQQELALIVDHHSLRHFFQGILGSTEPKSQVIESIVQSLGVPADALLFIGDSLSDFEAAIETNVRFIGWAHSDRSPFPKDVTVVEDFSEAHNLLQSHFASHNHMRLS